MNPTRTFQNILDDVEKLCREVDKIPSFSDEFICILIGKHGANKAELFSHFNCNKEFFFTAAELFRQEIMSTMQKWEGEDEYDSENN